ncbi:MAG: folate family ECF transporter S component [Bacillota bacterium]|nr:folate family ECF transporter S component [Bacillota bacterium]
MKLDLKTLVTLALLVAINIILTRIFVIYITDFSRLDLGNVPIILAGLFFGPAAGAIAGAAADIFGSAVLSGRGWYPPLTVGPLLMGLIPGLLRSWLQRKPNWGRVLLIVILAEAVASILWKTFWLAKLYNMGYFALLALRGPVALILIAVETILVYILYKRLLPVVRKNQG